MKDKLWKQIVQEDERGLPVLQGNLGLSRRTFLELIGYTTAAIALTSCAAPEQKIVPFLRQPPELTPGVANWYASTCGGCRAACGTLVKVRDGRPIKLEGNPEHPLSQGGLCPVAHSLIFGLYDAERLQQPLIGGSPATWKEADERILQDLNKIKGSGGKVRFLSNTIVSPTSRAVINEFLSEFKDAKHIVYEPISTSAVSLAHGHTHGVETVPDYRFEKARVIVSFGADFLGTWISPAAFTRGYAQARDLKGGKHEMARHIQFESRLSLTGANADSRVTLAPAEEQDALVHLAKLVAAKAGVDTPTEIDSHDPRRLSEPIRAAIQKCANELVEAKGASLVLCGTNDLDKQHLVNFINHAVGNYGATIRLGLGTLGVQSRDEDMQLLLQEMKDGSVSALFILNSNPVYDHLSGDEFAGALAKVPLKVSLSPAVDETSALADLVCPTHHFLEAWDDAEVVGGVQSLNQPTIAPLFQTRAYQESLMRWSGDDRRYYEALRLRWQVSLFPKQSQFKTFDDFWDKALHDGVFVPSASAESPLPVFKMEGVGEAVTRLMSPTASNEGMAIILYPKVTLGDGRYGNNPWLHELPDPISKTTWDNYACISPQTARKLNLSEGQLTLIKKGSTAIELPVLIQAGQSDDCVAVALGYGRTRAGKVGNDVGANAFPFVEFSKGTFRYQLEGISLEPTSKRVALAKTQTHDSAEGRPLIKEHSLTELIGGHLHEKDEMYQDLWAPHAFPEHKWGMVVDLNACVGCNACVLSCQAENNIPVVGKDEVGRRREMHWMRIDRYYDERPDGTTTRFQPMTCEHCDNASCETVCPVLATVHSSEGLNMQVYNRCVGTRYCANNCPFKVRRFNWFLYSHDDPVANLALNPDVTVRSRGVMEKCTFCVQRIEEGKIRARNEGRPIKDREIQTACQQSCPANAIVFGDLKDLESGVATLTRTKRNYILLEELNLRPGLTYLAKVRNDGEHMEG